MGMLDAGYVDTVEEKSGVASHPNSRLGPVFEVTTTRGISGIVLKLNAPGQWNPRGRISVFFVQMGYGRTLGLSDAAGGLGDVSLTPGPIRLL